MKFLAAFLFVFLSFNSSAQNLELSGTVQYYDLKTTGKIYYAAVGEKFSTKNFITYDKNKRFTFRKTIAELKTSKIKTLVFAIDTTQKTDDIYACVHRINVAEILNANEFKKLKTIKLKSDLLIDENCTTTVAYRASDENKDRFVGEYELFVKDTIRSIELRDMLYNAKTKLFKPSKDHMDEEYGGWNYNSDKKILSIYVSTQLNGRFGLALRKSFSWDFFVDETDGKMKFQSKQAVLVKK